MWLAWLCSGKLIQTIWYLESYLMFKIKTIWCFEAFYKGKYVLRGRIEINDLNNTFLTDFHAYNYLLIVLFKYNLKKSLKTLENSVSWIHFKSRHIKYLSNFESDLNSNSILLFQYSRNSNRFKLYEVVKWRRKLWFAWKVRIKPF